MLSMPSSNEWGWYRYKGAIYLTPYLALEQALKSGDSNPDITFEMPTANLIDWTVSPEETLAALYHARAKQLREQYGYLILMYSGGSDSHNALLAFLENAIPLDEIRTYYPVQWAERLADADVARDNPLGLLYEYNKTVVPGLALVRKLSPRTKIKVVDTSGFYAGDMSLWQTVLPLQHRVSGGVHGLFVANFRAAIELDLVCNVPPARAAVIYGVDKPPMYLNPLGELFVRFHDTWRMGVSHYWTGSGGSLFTPEMFYWGDLRITCRQVHAIKQAMEECAPYGRIISDTDAHRRLIYPQWTFPYQCAEGLHGGLLERCTDAARAQSIARERTGLYNGLWRGASISDEPASTKNGLRFLFARETKRYRVGQLKERNGEVPRTDERTG